LFDKKTTIMTLFNPEDNQAMQARIEALQPDALRQWGKMEVAQMLAHCIQPLRIAFREVRSKRAWIGFFFGAISKRRYVSGAGDFDKNLPTDPTFVQTGERDFETEKAQLLSYIQRFLTEGPEAITTDMHPFFGKLTPDDWDKLTIKHLDHHLRQFGA
jgi:hypothetical protein